MRTWPSTLTLAWRGYKRPDLGASCKDTASAEFCREHSHAHMNRHQAPRREIPAPPNARRCHPYPEVRQRSLPCCHCMRPIRQGWALRLSHRTFTAETAWSCGISIRQLHTGRQCRQVLKTFDASDQLMLLGRQFVPWIEKDLGDPDDITHTPAGIQSLTELDGISWASPDSCPRRGWQQWQVHRIAGAGARIADAHASQLRRHFVGSSALPNTADP
jgi:hypothetical protein